MNQIKRRSLMLSALAAPTVSLIPTAWAKGRSLTIMDYFTGSLGEKAFAAQMAKFTAKTGIRMETSPIGMEAFKTNILVRAASHSLPDIFSYWAGARVQFLVDSHSLHPIDNLWTKAELGDVIAKPVAAAATMYNGKRYLVPFDYHYVAMFYNPKVFAKAGVSKAPKTWDEFIGLCKHLKSKGITPIALGSKNRWPAEFWFDYLLLRTAGPDYRAKLMDGRAKYTDPQVVEAFSLWKDILEAGYFIPNANAYEWTDAADQVSGGKAAMTLMGTWITGYWDQNKLTPKEDYDFFMFPVVKKGAPNAALGPVDGLVIAENTRNLPDAEKFLAFMMKNVAVQTAWVKAQGALSANVNVSPESYNAVMRKAAATVKHADVFAFNYDLATPPPVASVGLNLYARFVNDPKGFKAMLPEAQKHAQAAFHGIKFKK